MFFDIVLETFSVNKLIFRKILLVVPLLKKKCSIKIWNMYLHIKKCGNSCLTEYIVSMSFGNRKRVVACLKVINIHTFFFKVGVRLYILDMLIQK